MNNEAYLAFQLYLGLKLHFSPTSTYDFFKYQGKVNCTRLSFDKRNDRYMFHKLSKKLDPQGQIVACLLQDPNMWIGDIVSNVGGQHYKTWLARQESLSYIYKQSLSQLEDSFDDNIKKVVNGLPLLMNLAFKQQIPIEMVIIIDRLCNCIQYWDKQFAGTNKGNLIYDTFIKKIKKYHPFVDVDLQKFKQITCEYFADRS